ncbi:transposase, partial [Vibrio parahaemolyticus]|uniref:transposase n=1 Tax=Vibrio parahaemolyticus TaxID=670 RepID=UPI0015DF066C
MEGRQEKPRTGRPPFLISEQRDQLSQCIKDKANDFKNVSVIKLPPYSPELNSIEQVWSGLRQRYLATNLLLITTTSSPKSAMH